MEGPATDLMTVGLVGSERGRRHPHHRACSASCVRPLPRSPRFMGPGPHELIPNRHTNRVRRQSFEAPRFSAIPAAAPRGFALRNAQRRAPFELKRRLCRLLRARASSTLGATTGEAKGESARHGVHPHEDRWRAREYFPPRRQWRRRRMHNRARFDHASSHLAQGM